MSPLESLNPVWAVAAIFTLGAVASQVIAGPGWRRSLGVALALLTIPIPLFMPSELVLLRATLSLIAISAVMRAWDLARQAPSLSPLHRFCFSFAFYDTRLMRWRRPDDWLRLAVTAPLFGAGIVTVVVGIESLSALPPSPLTLCGRALLGMALFYLGIESFDRFFRAGYGAVGLTAAPLQRAPIAATSLADFWGRRWNTEVHRWVRRHVFFPLARWGGAPAGVLGAFAFTAAMHAWPTWVALDVVQAGWMMAFFAAQGVLMFAERRLGVAQWPQASARVWVVASMALTAPLFVMPGLKLFSL